MKTRTAESRRGYIPATGLHFLLPLYDFVVARVTSEQIVKNQLVEYLAGTSRPLPRILDVGCGTGTLLLNILMHDMARRSPDGRQQARTLTGIDVDEQILRLAVQKTRQLRIRQNVRGPLDSNNDTHPVSFVRGRAECLPFADNSFSAVVSSLVFHHLNCHEKERTLREINRVLEPGGLFLLADYAQPANVFSRLRFLPVRILDGWQQTKANATGLLASQIRRAGFQDLHEGPAAESWLGTVRTYVSTNVGV